MIILLFHLQPQFKNEKKMNYFIYTSHQSAWSEHKDQTTLEVFAHKKLKDNGKSLKTFSPEKWSRSLKGGGRLR